MAHRRSLFLKTLQESALGLNNNPVSDKSLVASCSTSSSPTSKDAGPSENYDKSGKSNYLFIFLYVLIYS